MATTGQKEKIMIYTCYNGSGHKVEISLVELLHVSDVFKDYEHFAFIATYQLKAKTIPVAGFATQAEAERERTALLDAFQAYRNQL
jgi:hypothetical protein